MNLNQNFNTYAWTQNIGHHIIQDIGIGSSYIDHQYDMWLSTWESLVNNGNNGYNQSNQDSENIKPKN